MIHDFQMVETPEHVHVAFCLCRLPQNRRNQHPALRIHFDHLPVVTGPLQKLALRLILAGHLRQLLFNPHPNLQGINQRRFARNARDVELIPILPQPVEKHGGYLETTLFVDRRPTVSPKAHLHLIAGCSASPMTETQGMYLPICCPRSSNRPKRSYFFVFLRPLPYAVPIASTLPYFGPPPTTFYHFSPHLKLIAFLVKQNRQIPEIFFTKVLPRSSTFSTPPVVPALGWTHDS